MINLLPCDGIALYSPNAVDYPDLSFSRLQKEIPWQRERITMFGKRIELKRQVSLHADAGLSYKYSGETKFAVPWTPALLELKARSEEICLTTFNSCLLNLYEDGTHSMGWHSDNERALGPDPLIASISLGAERVFSFRHIQTGEVVSVLLENGSLLFMGSGVQQNWRHALPKSSAMHPRINLTFRKILL